VSVSSLGAIQTMWNNAWNIYFYKEIMLVNNIIST